MLLQCEQKTGVSTNQDCRSSQLDSNESFTGGNNHFSSESKPYEFDLLSRANNCQKNYQNPNKDSEKRETCPEFPEQFAHRLLIEFGKTRTNYNSLVPRIIEVIRLFRDYGPLHCPLPVVSNLEELLNDEALSHIEQRYPNSLDAGFVVLCTERRALRSGGGGKYYFIDVSGRLVGCHKSDLPTYADKKVLNGPVLLKNLIFVFIMRGAYGLDPRCKSSNPQRLLEYYENLAKEGKIMDIQRLVRVWSMEIFPESPFDAGYPHCSLLWVKRMHLGAHITKWKRSHWNSAQMRAQEIYPQHNQMIANGYNQYFPTNINEAMHFPTGNFRHTGNKPVKRRKTTKPAASPMPKLDLNWNNVSSGQYQTYQNVMPECHQSFMNDRRWDSFNVYQLYTSFNQHAPMLEKSDVCDWSFNCVERLSTQILAAAVQLLTMTFQLNVVESYDENDHAIFKNYILRTVESFEDRKDYIEALRILLACLVQQQRLESIMPKNDIMSPDVKYAKDNNVMTPLASVNYHKNAGIDWRTDVGSMSTTGSSGLKSNTETPVSYQSSNKSQYSYQTVTSPRIRKNMFETEKSETIISPKSHNNPKTDEDNTQSIENSCPFDDFYLNADTAWDFKQTSALDSTSYVNKKRSIDNVNDSYFLTPIYYSKDLQNQMFVENSNIKIETPQGKRIQNYEISQVAAETDVLNPMSLLEESQNIDRNNNLEGKNQWNPKSQSKNSQIPHDSLQYHFEETCLAFINELSDSTAAPQ